VRFVQAINITKKGSSVFYSPTPLVGKDQLKEPGYSLPVRVSARTLLRIWACPAETSAKTDISASIVLSRRPRN
jgi:hypothetical protein